MNCLQQADAMCYYVSMQLHDPDLANCMAYFSHASLWVAQKFVSDLPSESCS